jgi:HlyD family secretion protein
MTANVRITTDSREAVLKVPNSALRFRPPGEAPPELKAAASANGDGGDKGGPTKAGGSGALGQFRERLVTELNLDTQQLQRLDPIFSEARNKFMGLRDLPEEARAKAGAAIRAEMRARIEDILKPEQKDKYAQIVAESAGRSGTTQTTRGRIYLLVDNAPKLVEVRVGLSDGTMSEVRGDGVSEGADVIIGVQGGASGSGPAQKGSPPRMFF